jgi:hypothetical protein
MPLQLPPLQPPPSAEQQKPVRSKNKTWREFFRSDKAILIFCISIAFVFWLTTKLSKVYNTTVKIKIAYDLPDGQIFRDPPPEFFEVDVQASGWELTNIHRSVLRIDANEFYQHTILDAQDLQKRAQQIIGKSIQLFAISPKELNLYLEPLVIKTLPIIADLQIETDDMYRLAGLPNLDPKFVKVKGPKSIMDTLSVWKTQVINIKDIRTAVRQNIALRTHPNSQVSFEVASTDISIDVQQITEKQISVPIEIQTGSDSLLVVLIPQTVTLTCIVGLKDFNKIQVNDFQLFVNPPEANNTNDENDELQVQIRRKPDYLEVVKIEPQSVRYLLRKISN